MADKGLPRDYYAELGVSPTATAAQIRSAFRNLAKQHHPDKKGPGFDGDSSAFRKVREAYEKLIDPRSREQYDQERAKENSDPDPRPFNIFNRRTKPSSHPNAKFHSTGTEFTETEEEPEFKNARRRKGPWDSLHNRSYSSPYATPTAHGLEAEMVNHPAVSTSGRKCPYQSGEWRTQSGTNMCIFCMVPWDQTHRCPGCNALACKGCLGFIKQIETEGKRPKTWYQPSEL